MEETLPQFTLARQRAQYRKAGYSRTKAIRNLAVKGICIMWIILQAKMAAFLCSYFRYSIE